MILERYKDERYFADRQALLKLTQERYDACMAALGHAQIHGVAARIRIPDPESLTGMTKEITINDWHVKLALRVQFALLCDLQDAAGVARVADIPFSLNRS